MPKATLVFAALLIALGAGAFTVSGSRTALLPAFVGGALAVLAGLSLTFAGARRHLMHVAAVVALLGASAPAAALAIRAAQMSPLALLAGSSFFAVAQAEDPVAGEARLAVVVLETLPVKGRAPKTGYSREAFGPSWADTDYNGCDTRNDMLRRDLVDVVLKPRTRGCVVLEGVLVDPYSGEEIPFIKGDSSDLIHIDHVVSLSNAWQTGMFQRGPEERRIFANDPLNLLAVQGWLNQQKGDGDAATWLPPRKAYRCEFVARQVAVKAAYSLWLTPPEKQAMLRILRSCPGQTLPTR